MKRRLICALLVLLFVFTLAACGKTGQNGSGETPQAGEASSGSESPGSGSAAQTPGETVETLKVGLLIHQTGWFSAVDLTNYYEFNAMTAYINENLGGWKVGDTTYMLEAVIVDGQSDPDAIRTAAIALVDAGVKFVAETNDFWVIANNDVFEDAGVLHSCNYPTFVPGYIDPSNPMTFTTSNGSVGDYAAAFEVLHRVYPDVRTVVFAENDNGVNMPLFEVAKGYAAGYGIELIDGYVMYAGDTTDFSAVALQIVQSGADCFMGNGTPDAYGAILKEVRALGSDAVMACVQGKPVSMVMQYVPESARYNGFTLAPSTKESDRSQNTEILNGVVEKVRELFGDEQASNFDGAACNNLWVMLQFMKQAGSVDPRAVAQAWENSTTVETIFGIGTLGGLQTYGVANHAVANPKPVSIIDPDDPDGWRFWGWVTAPIP